MASQTTSSKPQSAMAALMASHKSKFVSLKKGEAVKGKITKLSSSEITLDVGAKTEAVVLEKEKRILHTILGSFKVGDTVEASVLNPESENGHPIVSLRRFLADISWKKLDELQKSKEQIAVTVDDVTKAGYVVATDFGVSGFLPQSHTSQADVALGQQVQVTVLELNRKDNKIIFSQKPALSEEDFVKASKEFSVGDKVTATITNVSPFGIFVTLSTKDAMTLEGFIHISEVAWEKTEDLPSLFTAGQTIETVVTRCDSENRRVNLSIKRLTADPFEKLSAQFPLEQKVSGTITKIDDAGITVQLEDTEGFIKQEKVPPTATYAVGQQITATVSEHDKKRHKIILVPVLREKPIGYR